MRAGLYPFFYHALLMDFGSLSLVWGRMSMPTVQSLLHVIITESGPKTEP